MYEILFWFSIFIIVLLIIFNIALLDRLNEVINEDNKSFDFVNDMNREQKRLFDKQLIAFKGKFNRFSNYQLKVISDLCIDIIKERS